MPRITVLEICPTHNPNNVLLNQIAVKLVTELLPAATSLRSLTLSGYGGDDSVFEIARPNLHHLSVAWNKVTMTPETAATLKSLEIACRETDFKLLPPLPAVETLAFVSLTMRMCMHVSVHAEPNALWL